MSIPRLPIIPFEGAACGGKSLGVAHVRSKLEALGHRVFTLEEIATLLDRCGVKFKHAFATGDFDRGWRYEEQILRAAFMLENILLDCAGIDGHANMVFLPDRGCSNPRSFLPEHCDGDALFRKMLKGIRLRPLEALDRYAGVIDMVTAADGAEAYYSNDTNAIRDETPDLARYLERRTQDAWLGHEHFWIIDNSTDFPQKLDRAYHALCRILGIPNSVEIERKWLLATVPSETWLPVTHRTVCIEQTYLKKHDGLRPRLRRRYLPEDPGYSTYYLTEKGPPVKGVREELENRISRKKFNELRVNRDPERGTIKKDGIYFVWDGQYFRLDVYKNLSQPLATLERELLNPNDPVRLPPFLKIKDDVTDDENYGNARLARQVLK